MSKPTHTGRNGGNSGSSTTRALKLIIYVTAAFLLFFSGFLLAYKLITDSGNVTTKAFTIDPKDKIEVYIKQGWDTAHIAHELQVDHVIDSAILFRIYSGINGYDGTYQYGTHYVSNKLDYSQIMQVLTAKPETVKVMIPEGYNLLQIRDLLVKNKLVDGNKFMQAAKTGKYDYQFLKDLPAGTSLEGYLFPDTYEFDPNSGEEVIIDRMLSNFDDRFKTSFYERAKTLGMTPRQVVILASIVEKEAATTLDRPRIAGVFMNRLSGNFDIAKKLESCATLQYIIYNRTGNIKPVLTSEDTKIDDPYNTYKNEGLPPGPISNPGIDSIEAVLNPEVSSYLYFVAKNDGTGMHYFSTTLAEHQQAASIFAGVDQTYK